MKLSITAGLMCTALVAIAVGCGGDDDTATNTPGRPASVTATTGNGGTATATDEATPDDAANGGNDDGDIAEYFRDLAARFEFSRQDSDAAVATFNTDLDAAVTLDQEKQVINDFLDDMIQVFDDSILTMNGFSVPAIAEDPHFTFRDDIVEAKAISETLKDDLDAAETGEEAQAIINDFDAEVGALIDHAQAACRELQDIADEQNIDEDLECNAP
ncbi:MAG: hypothetical protein WD904_09825 [Dehalococcoidia bacterium]